MRFSYSNPTGITLSTDQEELLATLDEVNSPLQGISRFGDLHCRNGVEVFIVDNGYILNYLKNRRSSLKQEMSKYYSRERTEKEQAKVNYLELSFKNIDDSISRASEGMLLGLYSGKVNWFDERRQPDVFLIADNIEKYSTSHNVEARFVFGFVYVHEMMHAYYDSLNYRGYPSVTELEEAFTECGMLYCLHELSGCKPLGAVFGAAYDNVSSKQESSALPHYGFGLYIYQNNRREKMLSEHIERYREISNWINLIPTREEIKNYSALLRQLYPSNDRTEQLSEDCFQVVKSILYSSWQEPRQHRVKSTGISIRASHITLDDLWAIHTNNATRNVSMLPIIETRDVVKMTAYILKFLKWNHMEPYFHTHILDAAKDLISVDFDNGSAFIEDIFRVTTRPKASRMGKISIPEDLSFGHPYYQTIDDDKAICQKLLQLIAETMPLNVSLVKGYGVYTLWGDSETKQIFEPIIGRFQSAHYPARESSSSDKIHQYYIIYYHGQFITRSMMQRIPLAIFKDMSRRDISEYQRWPINILEEFVERMNSVYQLDGGIQKPGDVMLMSVDDYNDYQMQLEQMNATSHARFDTNFPVDLSKFHSGEPDNRFYVRFILHVIAFQKFREIIKDFGYEIEEA